MAKSKKVSSYAFIILWVVYAILATAGIVAWARISFNRTQSSLLEKTAETKALQFEAGLVSQMPLALQMAKMPSAINYMKNPADEELKALALEEFKVFQNSFLSKSSFWISDADKMFWSNLEPAYVVDVDDPNQYWYKMTMNDSKDYNFNINYNPDLGITNLWVNACVRDEKGKAIGIAGTGIPLTGVIDTMYEDLDPNFTMYLYNSDLEITGAADSSLIAEKVNLFKQVPELQGENCTSQETQIIKTKKGIYIVKAVPSVNWYIIISRKYTFVNFVVKSFEGLSFYIIIGLIIAIIQFFIMLGKPLNILKSSIADISSGEGDLTKRIDLDGISTMRGLSHICEGFNGFIGKLNEIVASLKVSKDELVSVGETLASSTKDTTNSIDQIISTIAEMNSSVGNQTESVEQTAESVNSIATAIDSLNNLVEAQVKVVESASASIEEMVGSINSVNNSVVKMESAFVELEQKAIKGIEKQNNVNAKILEIEEESQALQEANAVILGITEQTNLLAMNAAIEAAHAGEAGKGFSVVADEIRKLSEDSGEQSQNIGNQLAKISSSIEAIVEASQIATSTFNEVTTGINDTSNLVREITNAMAEQNAGSSQIVQALTSMNETSAEVKISSKSVAEGNKSILNEVQNLQDVTFTIKENMEKMSEDARSIAMAGASLAELSNHMEGSINQIGSQIDQFRV